MAASIERLVKDDGNLWDSGNVSSSQQNNIPYQGLALKSGQTCYWKVRVRDNAGQWSSWSPVARWEMGLLSPGDWKALWLDDGKPVPASDADFYKEDHAPLFRKEFSASRKIRRARLSIAGLGYYEASLNGKRVGDHVLDPGWTAFSERVLYDTYDVTKMLVRGRNCIGVTLGNGWFNPLPMRMWGSRNLRDALTTGRPRFIAQLRLEYVGGGSDTIVSDTSWKVGEGAIRRNNVYLGEVVDARLDPALWGHVGFDDAKWRAPSVAAKKLGRLSSPTHPPIRETRRWSAVSVKEPKPGIYVYDMGENFAGWVSLKLNVPAGTQVQLRYGELLYADGTLNPMTGVAGQIKGLKRGSQESVGGPGAPPVAWQADTYIARGGRETYQPRFTFHGFRYVEVSGVPKPLPLEAVVASRLNSDLETAGSFECSDPMLNRIQAMCRRTFLSNVFSVQSDCPHREKFGYGGDIVATSEAMIMNFDMAGFYQKAVRDWSDSALKDGMFTDTAPFVGIQYCGVVWAMAHPLLIDQLFRYYGDSSISEEQYDAAKKWLALVEERYPNGIVTDGLSDHEGLAPAPAPDMVTPMTFHTANLLRRMADRLGRKADAAHFADLAGKIQSAYVAKFVNAETGKIGPGTQASQSVALYSGIVPEVIRPQAFAFLVKDIEAHAGHLTTGIIGTKAMLDVLSRNGRADLAYAIVSKKDFPSWGWMLENGATTLWEHWELSDNTFSHNHPMFGSVSQWFMQWLGGIQPGPESRGFDRVSISPRTPEGLKWVKSSYRSIRGKVVSNWAREGSGITFEIEIPANTVARVSLLADSVAHVHESGRPLAKAQGVSNVMTDGHTVEFEIGSGAYSFFVASDRNAQE
ncbi:MAG: family 78 glycoside hydrolase catalytic domain [Armatimonadetes bacterium]|nr:family 78 glycoside hydrolase catalytic domain [Armatimonadota bacterium]